MATRTTQGALLDSELLERFAERAPTYDRENRFFHEDFDELREIGYLTIAVPEELGGAGMSLADVCRLQRQLGYHAASTALAVNMHLYWTGVAADLWRAGDTSLQWLLEEAVEGEVFAAGHAESGNDIPVLLSTTRAERVDGGYRFTGRKAFGSLGPAWTQLGLHGLDTSDPDAPKVVHAFAPRDSPGHAPPSRHPARRGGDGPGARGRRAPSRSDRRRMVEGRRSRSRLAPPVDTISEVALEISPSMFV